MKIILESTFTDALKKIKVGDVLEVNSKDKNYFDVENTSGEEIIVKKDKEVYLLRKNAFSNNTLEFFMKGDRDFNKRGSLRNVNSLRIIRDGVTIDRITDSDTEKGLDKLKNKLGIQVKKQKERKFQFISDIQGLNVGDKLNIIIGKVNDNGTINEKTKSIIEFIVMGFPKKNNFYLEFIKCEGPDSDKYQHLKNIDLLLISPKSPIITSHNDDIKVKLFSNDKNYVITNVLDLQKEKIDNSVVVSKDDILNNKYFRNAMIKDASWLRKLFGSNIPKGIIPSMEKLKSGNDSSKEDVRIKKNNKILFSLVTGSITSDDVTLKGDTNYYSRIKNDFTFKVPLQSEEYTTYARFKIIKRDKLRENTYNVNIEIVRDNRGFNVSTKKFKGKIKIKNYNY